VINKYSDVPMYCQLKNLLIDKIENKDFIEDTKIPSEQELCALYSISRPTVRQAISELTSSGYLYKEKGKGTFVAKSKSKVDIKNYSGFTDSILDSQFPEEKIFISSRIVRSSEINKLEEIFAISNNYNKDFAEIIYQSSYNSEVYSLNTSYIQLSLFPDIIEDIQNKKPSYDILRGKYALLPVKTKSTLEISYTEQNDARYLQVQSGQALLRIENILYSKSSQVVEYIISKYRADKCKLIFENVK